MKTRNLLIYVLLSISGLCFHSCLKEQSDIFDQPASIRMQNLLNETQKVLVSSQHGWSLNMYPGKEQEYGAFLYTLKFDNEKVAVNMEFSDSTVVTYYSMKSDMGPVLSFDSYNELIHLFSKPSMERYEAFHGDFEFVIDSLGQDKIKLRAKRTDNIMYLKRLDKPAKEYMAQVARIREAVENSQITIVKGKIGNDSINGEFAGNDRRLYYEVSGGEDAGEHVLAFGFNAEGIELYKPFTINGHQFDKVQYDDKKLEITFLGKGGDKVVLKAFFPDTYLPYEAFAGDYVFTYAKGKGKIDVKLVPVPEKQIYLIKGFSSKYDIVATYNRGSGHLEIHPQAVAELPNGGKLWLAVWDLNGEGNLTWSPQPGFICVWNKDKQHPVIQFKSLPGSRFNADSFILWTTDANNKSAGQLKDKAWFASDGSNEFPFIEGLVKK